MCVEPPQALTGAGGDGGLGRYWLTVVVNESVDSGGSSFQVQRYTKLLEIARSPVAWRLDLGGWAIVETAEPPDRSCGRFPMDAESTTIRIGPVPPRPSLG